LESIKNISLLSIFSIALVSMILITSQSPAAFAGACQDEDRDGYYHTSSPSYCGETYFRDCDDTDPEVYPGMSTCAFPYREAMDSVEAELADLVASGDFDINSSQATHLLNRLQQAADQIEADKINVSINTLNSFINNINAYINNGSISQYDGDGLIAGVQVIITTLENN
jgi:hypothetical protein